MKFRVVACGVFEPYIRRLAPESPHEIDLRPLDAGLHARPNDLRLLVQNEIDETARAGGYDAVLLFYGLCGRGTANLLSRDTPVVIPRAHDCITLFLGSDQAYRRQFHKNPGTFYHTLGWIEKKINPKNREATELYTNYERDGYDKHPDFDSLARKYGEDNARHVVSFLERWRQHYTRAAYIDLGFPDEDRYVEYTREMARVLDWKHEVIQGDPTLMRQVLAGDWSDSRCFVLPPNSRSVSTGDDRILEAMPVDQEEAGDLLADADIVLEAGEAVSAASGIGLGIDAGGTYTDAVIYDLGARKVLAKAKSLTTYHDLVEGIRGAIGQLPAETLQTVEVTSLSTTLATNAIVEGRGHKVGLLVLSPFDWFEAEIGHQPCIRVPGATGITGEVLEELDEAACRQAVDRLVNQERCAAIVVAGYATTRNPEQANRVREIAADTADVPVICAHEVSRRLDSIQGAHTALANARLLPVIRDLIDSVHRALAELRVPGRLMVVKGDGTPVDESIARARPVETILSGPAASVSGARVLTGLDDALVLDIGGTTTDCAILEEGRVAVSPEGARVGSWTMAVDAVEISTVGLGGDSRIDFDRERRITVGPTRNIPLCWAAGQRADIAAFLRDFDRRKYAGTADASWLDVLTLGGPGALQPTEAEVRLLALLADGPLPALRAAEHLGLPSPLFLPTSRLEACGMVKRCALTPTDLLHVTGRFSRWDGEAARNALEAFAAMVGRPATEVLEEAMREVTRRLFEEVVRREVTFEDRKLRDLPADWRFLLDKAFEDNGRGLEVKLSLRRPIVAIGAPAEALVPAVRNHIATEVVVPEHADVANAVGGIASEIVMRDEVMIQPGQTSNYVLYATEERAEFNELKRATDRAVELARARARRLAVEAGAFAPSVTVSQHDRTGSLADGGRLLIERRITAVASGAAFVGAAR